MYRMPGCDDWLIAQLGKEDLFFLLAHILRRPDIGHPWLYERCREVEQAPDDHLDLWAREHYKSTIITFGLSIQDILRDAEVTIGIFSHTRPIAKAFLRQIKLELEVNDTLKSLYPETLWADPKKDSPKWSEDEGIVVRRKTNPKEATVEAWGLVDGMPVSKHYRVLNYDDVVTKESVNTPEMMQKTTTALELSYSLGSEGGARRFAGTRYHYNDTYRTVLERGTATLRLYDGTEGNSGDIKRPVLWSPELMAKKRRDYGVYTFACQILQNPKADSTHGMQREWLEFWTPDKGAGLNKYILRDPANSKKESADYTTDWVVGLGPDENYYILAVYRDRLNLTERTNRLFELHRTWKPVETRYEEYGLQADIEHIKSEMDARKYRFKIVKVGGRVRKEERIKRLIPLFENHRIILPRAFHITTAEHETKDMVHEFVENEYMAFPVPVHDDMLDALARITDTEGHIGDLKVKLALKWPSQQTPTPKVAPYEPLDRGMGM
jgi:phage terminase large subunit-like protein